MSDHEAELIALRKELADTRRENRVLRQQIAQLTLLVAEQNERLGDITSILRRREDQLSRGDPSTEHGGGVAVRV